MSKGQPTTLLDVIQAIRQLAETLELMTVTMTEQEVKTFEQFYLPEETSRKPEKNAQKKPVTLSDVRAVLAGKSRNGLTSEVKALLKKHGAEKLSGIDKSEYASLMKEAEELGS